MTLFSKKGKLIVAGDSYSDQYRRENFGFADVWGNHLAKFLDRDEYFKAENIINIANSGAGNYEIFSRTLDEIIFNKNIYLIVIMWSEFQRFDFEIDMSYKPVSDGTPHRQKKGSWYSIRGGQTLYQNMHPPRVMMGPWPVLDSIKDRPSLEPEWKHKLCKVFHERNFDSLPVGVNKFMRFVFTLQEMCEKKNIRLIQCMGTEPIISDEPNTKSKIVEQTSKLIIDHPYFGHINSKTWIGWPIMRPLGGFSIDNYLTKLDKKIWGSNEAPVHGSKEFPPHYRMSVKDSHPNGRGHLAMAELIYDNYKKIYSKT